jgi:hypothetical protein
MGQIDTLKMLLGNTSLTDPQLQFYLDNASDIICSIRNSDKVETQYLRTQIKMAVEMVNKIGAEGQTSHSENGISRTYEASDLSPSLIAEITPIAKTPFSTIRTV